MNETNTNTVNDILPLGVIFAVCQDVLKRWYLILIAALIAAMGTFMVIDSRYQPQYKTTTTFVATTGNTNATTYSNLSTASNMAAAFSEVLNSSILKQKVLEEVGIEAFGGTIQASVIESTNLLTMTVTGDDPRIVFQVTKAIIEHHHIVSDEVLGSNILEVLQNPLVPTKPIQANNVSKRVLQVFVLAAMAVGSLVCVISYLSDKVRSKQEADSKLSCHVLGELYHERKRKTWRDLFFRGKKSILITDPLTSFIYVESIHKLSGRIDKRRHKSEHVIMVTSLLENEGKSTVAVNLALSMAQKGKKVLLIDADMRKPACHLILGVSNKLPGLADILHEQATLNESVHAMEGSGLRVMTTKRSQSTATNLLNSPAMEQLLQTASAKYDMVVIDTPPMSMAPDAEYISEFADASLLVVRQNAAMVNDLEDAISILEKSESHLLGCVLNNVYGANHFAPAFSYGAYGYGRYGRYGKYGKYGYGKYGYGRSKEHSEEKA